MIKIGLTGLFLLLAFQGPAQNLIGLKADEVKAFMRTEQNDFSLDESTINKTYKYLKYVDDLETRTALYFLSDDSICTWYKVVYDNDLLAPTIALLDSTCRKVSDTLWLEKRDAHTYRKILDRQKWFFSVTTRPADSTVLKK